MGPPEGGAHPESSFAQNSSDPSVRPPALKVCHFFAQAPSSYLLLDLLQRSHSGSRPLSVAWRAMPTASHSW